MNGQIKTAGRKSETAPADPVKAARLSLLGLFVFSITFLIARLFLPLHVNEHTFDAITLFMAFATTLVSLSAQLPAQNIALAAVIIAAIGGGIHALNALTGIPFGPLIYKPESGPRLFGALVWFMPLWWVVAVLSSRGVARLILRPWRKIRAYGFWLIGITTLLTLLLELNFQPFATHTRGYWMWPPGKLIVDWFGTPLSDFLGWLVTTLLILAFSTPALMKRKPSSSGADFHPIIVWLALNFAFSAGAFSQHLLVPAIVGIVICLAIIPFAIRGAKW